MKKDIDLLCEQLCMYSVRVAGASISVNLCVFACVYVCLLCEVHMFSCGSVYIYIYICMEMYISMNIYMCVCKYICACVHVKACLYMCVCMQESV